MEKLGVIADDFTGATDIAGFLAAYGMQTVLCDGYEAHLGSADCDAIVVSLKIRSCRAREAVNEAVSALTYLQQNGCTRFYYKYCSTFDSTAQGNIGPVTDALMDILNVPITIVCPALPVNARTVYNGYLFVGDRLLHESSMKDHPINPMRDSKLSRLMEAQSRGKCSHIAYPEIQRNSAHIAALILQAKQDGFRYVVVDVVKDADLDMIAAATMSMPLVTGGSGLAIGIAKHVSMLRASVRTLQRPVKAPTVIFSGSCSEQTNLQVQYYLKRAPSMHIDESRLDDPTYPESIAQWIGKQDTNFLAPIVYSTKQADCVRSQIATMIESLFAQIAVRAVKIGIRNFIVAGGETSGAVVKALNLGTFEVGPLVEPGVPWIHALSAPHWLVLKSGNFGSIDFFIKAQEYYQ